MTKGQAGISWFSFQGTSFIRILCKNNKYYSFRLNWVIWDRVEVFSVWPRIGFLNLPKQIRYFKLETVA